MALLSVLLAFSLEYYFRWGSEYRRFGWFSQWTTWLNHQLPLISTSHSWLRMLIYIGIPVAAIPLIISQFSGITYYLVLLLTSCSVLFYCIGPKPLEFTMDSYFACLEREDKEAAFLVLESEKTTQDLPQSDDVERNATRFALVESHHRYFGVIVWFVFFGPAGALFYRLSHLYLIQSLEKQDEQLQSVSSLFHWIDWLPARLTSLLNLLTGDFMAGFYRFKDYWLTMNASNDQLLSETGIAALGLKMGMLDPERDETRDAIAMIIRTGIIYLVVVAGLSQFSFWW